MNTENKDLKNLVEMLNNSWNQVANDLPDDINELTAEQIQAYTTAMCVISKVEEMVINYFKTGKNKIVPIMFDKYGTIYK